MMILFSNDPTSRSSSVAPSESNAVEPMNSRSIRFEIKGTAADVVELGVDAILATMVVTSIYGLCRTIVRLVLG
jgi:hypothetical protein